ncbi:MAG TPA: lipoyl synthase [Bacteroidales bacterium]|nr:lipoyl synthase [Bacteroidales bacterium]
MNPSPVKPQRKPEWLRIKLPAVNDYSYIKEYLSAFGLHTICESGKCPNIAECWESKTATFMILGDRCTRNCSFCAVSKAHPLPVDLQEPQKLATVIKNIGLKHCVLTSVTRDDLDDGGAGLWHDTIVAIKEQNPGISIEALVPDFNGNRQSIDTVIRSKPDILSHNLETVSRLTPAIRIKARYHLSLELLKYVAASGITAKSGIMLGLGETPEEIYETMDDLLNADCSIITIGQYLQPSKKNHPVEKYYSPAEFEQLKSVALEKGFVAAESGPLVRSSYHAIRHLDARKNVQPITGKK